MWIKQCNPECDDTSIGWVRILHNNKKGDLRSFTTVFYTLDKFVVYLWVMSGVMVKVIELGHLWYYRSFCSAFWIVIIVRGIQQ